MCRQSSEDPASVAYEWQRTKAITAIVFVYPSDSLPDELYSADSESASSVNKLKVLCVTYFVQSTATTDSPCIQLFLFTRLPSHLVHIPTL